MGSRFSRRPKEQRAQNVRNDQKTPRLAKAVKRLPRFEIEVDVRAFLLLIVTIVMAVLFALCAFFYVRSFFGIKHFEVTGITTYDYNEVVNSSKLRRGDKLYSIDVDEIERNVLEGCPYLESVKVKRQFPNTLRFSVEERSAQWYIDIAGDYYILDGDLVIMNDVSSEQNAKALGATQLILPNLKGAMRGEVPDFGADEQEIRRTLELVAEVRMTTFKARITKLDLTSRFDIYITVDDTYEAYLGDSTNFAAKLETVRKLVDSESLKDHPKGTIDASGSTAYFKPEY